jgi:hypothetical protein
MGPVEYLFFYMPNILKYHWRFLAINPEKRFCTGSAGWSYVFEGFVAMATWTEQVTIKPVEKPNRPAETFTIIVTLRYI